MADFTWYLRNLLLVKTSDNPEEVLDVSSENLKLLKEESKMMDSDTLMRYIRIFSDLSNQIRMQPRKSACGSALIKLCSPAMETEPGFMLLDRIRVLEKQMEERPGSRCRVPEVMRERIRYSQCGGKTAPSAPAANHRKLSGGSAAKISESTGVIVQTTEMFKRFLQQPL